MDGIAKLMSPQVIGQTVVEIFARNLRRHPTQDELSAQADRLRTGSRVTFRDIEQDIRARADSVVNAKGSIQGTKPQGRDKGSAREQRLKSRPYCIPALMARR